MPVKPKRAHPKNVITPTVMINFFTELSFFSIDDYAIDLSRFHSQGYPLSLLTIINSPFLLYIENEHFISLVRASTVYRLNGCRVSNLWGILYIFIDLGILQFFLSSASTVHIPKLFPDSLSLYFCTSGSDSTIESASSSVRSQD